MLQLTEQTRVDILKHAASTQDEVCGFVLDVGDRQEYLACTNTADLPAEMFEIGANDWIKAEGLGEVTAIVHSHPESEPYLSGADRLAQHQSKLPWVLVTGGAIKIFRYAPLLRGRVFKYGKLDCMTLIRDAYHLTGIELPDPGRGEMDGDAAKDRFITEGVQHGFTRVVEPKTGDIILTAMGGNANHASLYLGQGEMLHHAYGQLSRREFYRDGWQRRTHSIWRHKDWLPEMLQAVKNDMEHSGW